MPGWIRVHKISSNTVRITPFDTKRGIIGSVVRIGIGRYCPVCQDNWWWNFCKVKNCVPTIFFLSAASAFFSAFASFSAVLCSNLAWFSRLSVPILNWRASKQYYNEIKRVNKGGEIWQIVACRIDRKVWVYWSSANDVNSNLVETDHHRNSTCHTTQGVLPLTTPYNALDLNRIRSIRGGTRTLERIYHIQL